MAVVVAVGIVATPASILSGAFVDILQAEADERRICKDKAATAFQRMFHSHKKKIQVNDPLTSTDTSKHTDTSGASGATDATGRPSRAIFRTPSIHIRDIVSNSSLKGLSGINPPFAALLRLYKTHKDGLYIRYIEPITWYLIGLNVLSVVLGEA